MSDPTPTPMPPGMQNLPQKPGPLSIEYIQPEVDEIINGVCALGEDARFAETHKDDANRWALMFRDDLPTCCAGHRVDALATIQYQSYLTVNMCEEGGCEDHLNHLFIREMVRIIGEAGRKMAAKGMLAGHIN